MLPYPLSLTFQRVRVIRKIRNDFLLAVLRDSKCIRTATVASELFDTSCAVWISQTITSFLEIKYQSKENNRQWGFAVITNQVEKITLPLTSTMIIGVAGDGGNGNNSVGFNSSLCIYTTANVYPTGISFIAICK